MNFREAYQRRIKVKPGEPGYSTRFGRTTLAKRSLTEVAEILGCSRQAVQQVERTAFHKLRIALLPVLLELNPELHRQVVERQ